ncbi:MAG: copper chaperone PCu(A)C [Nitrospiraceae bacterium]|nr:MAG: copper chaperone PCu(A)C [Nitrospiraceae bacterium]
MKKSLSATLFFVLLHLVSSAYAHEQVSVDNAWVRSAPPGADVMAAYMILKNESEETRVLTKVSSSMFNRIEIHRTEMHEGIMKMIPQDSLPVPAGSSVTLEPGGLHLMLIGPKSVPKEGDEVDLNLKFSNGHSQRIKVPVRADNNKGGKMEEHGHH